MLSWLSPRSIAERVARIRATLSVKLQAAFFFIIILLFAMGLISFLTIGRIERQARELDNLDRAVTLAQHGLDYSIVAQEHFSSMFVLTAEDAYRSKLIVEQQRFRKTLTQVQAYKIGLSEVERIDETFTRYEQASQATVKAKQAGEDQLAREIHVSREHVIAHEIEALTRSLVARVQESRQTGLARIVNDQRRANWIVGGFFLLSIGLALSLGAVLARSIVHPIQRVDATLERIARGEFVSVTDVVNRDELGSLVGHLNRMSHELAELYGKQRQATHQLEKQYETLRRTQAQLIQSERARARLRALGEMAGGVAHDFNNLLTIVLAQTQYLLQKYEEGHVRPEDAQQRLGAVQQVALDGGKTVRRLLEFTRARPRPSETEAVDIKELFTSVLQVAEPRWKDQAHAQGHHIEVKVDLRSVPPVRGNLAELREVLLNLVFNAVDAMPHGGILTLSSSTDGNAVYLAVQDTGIGISEEVSSRIFEPFFTTKGPQSSGLGLSVSHAIVRQHRGDLSVKSQPGLGTMFTLRLPVGATPEPPQVEATGRTPQAVAPSLRVLVVDDEVSVRRILRDILTDGGHRVWDAESGPEALEIMERQQVDLVYTDLGMPVMTGWQLADQIKERWPDVKVVVVTGWAVSITPKEVAAHHVDCLIAKPFQTKEILQSLSELMSAHPAGLKSTASKY